MPQWRQIFPDLSEYQPEVSKIRQENQINFNFISNSQMSVLYCKRVEYVNVTTYKTGNFKKSPTQNQCDKTYL